MRILTKFHLIKIKYFMIVVFAITVYIIISYTRINVTVTKNREEILSNETNQRLPNVVVHIDLKGSPPKISYLKTLLPKLQDLGVTGLLMEYEDMFPYEGKLMNLSARNCYTKLQLQEFITLAVRIGFDIIPLVQTYGHMEHILKLEEYRHLREIPSFPDSICPSKSQSRAVIREMLDQVIKFHHKIFPLKYFHIGCDEVFHINKCKQCSRRSLSNTDIYLSHIKMVTDVVKTISPNTTVLIWDDMFREIPMNVWEGINHRGIEPVYWDYEPNLRISHINMMKYHTKFENIWIASAFKGADGRTATFPDLKKRFSNHLSWMKLIQDYKFGGESKVYNFQGIILTGWSRYSHMDPPCELLPASIPSLFLNLLLIRNFKRSINDNAADFDSIDYFPKHLRDDLSGNLHCSDTVDIDYFDTHQCYFDGNELSHALRHCDTVNADILNSVNDIESGLFTVDFYSKTDNINMNKLQQNMDWCNDTINELMYVRNKMMKILLQYYDAMFVEEYVNYKLYNSKNTLDNLYKNFVRMFKVKSWKRRPYR